MRDLFGIDLPEDRLEDEEENDRKTLKSKVRILALLTQKLTTNALKRSNRNIFFYAF